MCYILLDSRNIVQAVSRRAMDMQGCLRIDVGQIDNPEQLLGRQVVVNNTEKMKVAVICNWNSPCGISTYSKFLVDALIPKVGEVRIFSEEGEDVLTDDEYNVVRCWKRGSSMRPTIQKIAEWGADFVIVQHEFGIFPHANHFLRMLHDLNHIPYAVVLHSVYTHLDKTIATSAIRNIIVHSQQAKETLARLGHDERNIWVVPHGCVVYDNVKELYNSFHTPYAIVQFGFGFSYKGVDRAIEAIAHLKKTDSKFKNIFYCYLCSQTAHGRNTHNTYTDSLHNKIASLGVEENVAIIQKFHPEQIINNYLRTAKMALFPYLIDPENMVFGASGAIRIAMANGIPVIASESHLFDDLEGVLPRPKNYLELAQEIDRVFSDESHRNFLVEKNKTHLRGNIWDTTADRYLAVMQEVLSGPEYLSIPTASTP